jgi:hypothetical protein
MSAAISGRLFVLARLDMNIVRRLYEPRKLSCDET